MKNGAISILLLQVTAEEEGFKNIAAAFKAIAVAEKTHEDRYRKLLENVMGDKVFQRDEKVFWYCRKCGYIHFGKNL
jgi:rubrerythrin